MNAAYKQILKATTLFSSVQGLNILINLVRTKLAAVLLGPAGVGLNGILNETRELIHTSTNMGMDQSGIREVSIAYGELQESLNSGEGKEVAEQHLHDAIMLTRSWIMLFALLGTLCMLLFAWPLSWTTFSDGSHVWQYVLLAPAVGFSTMTCGEMVIMKALQRLKKIATVSVINVIAGLFTTIPVYYFFGVDGVVFAIDFFCLSTMVIAMWFSYRCYSPAFCVEWKFLRQGKAMIVLGLSFVLAGLVASGSKLLTQTLINVFGGLADVGLYNAGYTVITTASVVCFAVLDNDFFPRLSSIFSNTSERNKTIMRQVKVGLLFSVPITAVLIIAAPILIPLLLSEEFMSIVPMVQIAAPSLICRALYQTISYLPLSAGHSKRYFVIQALSYIVYVPIIYILYREMGVTGIGVGFLVSNIFDTIAISILMKKWYF